MRINKKKYIKNLMEEHEKMKQLRECGNADHLTDENGNFKSTYETPEGTMCLGKLEEAMQWVFYQKEFEHEDKLKRILKLENIVRELLNGINYIPTWSTKLKNQL